MQFPIIARCVVAGKQHNEADPPQGIVTVQSCNNITESGNKILRGVYNKGVPHLLPYRVVHDYKPPGNTTNQPCTLTFVTHDDKFYILPRISINYMLFEVHSLFVWCWCCISCSLSARTGFYMRRRVYR